MVVNDVSFNGSTNVRVDGYTQESIKSEILKKMMLGVTSHFTKSIFAGKELNDFSYSIR